MKEIVRLHGVLLSIFSDRDPIFRLQGTTLSMSSAYHDDQSESNFDIGDWVFLKLRPHRQKSVLSRINAKLSARYYGAIEIISRIGTEAYRLKLP